jgi:bifunctional DNA-binding transcriptional regulator/antitoxin component of YhaV-PrlF toxin-antitoxin module
MAPKVKDRRVPRRRGVTRVSSKNQVTLPVAALAAAHLGPGDSIRVEVIADGVLQLVREHDPMAALIGSVPGLSAAADLEAMRDEWER